MKKYILTPIIFTSLIFFINSVVAAGSVTVTSQVLDSTVRPGGETTIFLTLANPSTTASVSNVKLSISPGPYITPSANYIEIGGLDISSSQQTSLTAKVSTNAISTISYIKVKVDYYVGTTPYESTINVPITIKRIPILQVSEVQYIPNLIEPGNKVTLYFNLKNEGDGPAKDVRVILNQTTEKFIVELSPETFVDSIGPKEAMSVSFDIIVDPSIDIGTHTIPITLIYLDETKNTNYTAVKYIGLTISGKYNFIITPSQSIVAPGKKGNVDIQVSNAGTQEALYLNLRILPSDPIIEVTPSAVYIGNLKSDDYDTEKFSFKINDNADQGVYPLNLQLNYRDPYGKTYTEDFEVDMTVSSIKEFNSSKEGKLSPFTIIVVILIIAAVAYFVYKKIKKRKK
jgi:hypothetical protein